VTEPGTRMFPTARPTSCPAHPKAPFNLQRTPPSADTTPLPIPPSPPGPLPSTEEVVVALQEGPAAVWEGTCGEPRRRALGITRDVEHQPRRTRDNPARAAGCQGLDGATFHRMTHAKTPSPTEPLCAPRQLSDARAARLRVGSGRVGATVGPAALGILGCEQGPPERCDSNCRRADTTGQPFSIRCLPGDPFSKCSV